MHVDPDLELHVILKVARGQATLDRITKTGQGIET